ncbi:MAG: TetR/AcrR family transcriptional regulator C-terminal ligand-binding domain-containing protein, partial [Actinomycetota bacterium]|nr:TetR/AcrR family transcriptional regulator C-terminal ligand-binding domain-containing protein [Actinomycetota bacterium]
LRGLAELLAGPAGEALRGLLGDALADPGRTRALRNRSHGSGRTAMREITRRAAERGEIRAGAVTDRRLDVAQAMLRQQFLFEGPRVPEDALVEIVDEVLLPVLHAAGPQRRDGG